MAAKILLEDNTFRIKILNIEYVKEVKRWENRITVTYYILHEGSFMKEEFIMRDKETAITEYNRITDRIRRSVGDSSGKESLQNKLENLQVGIDEVLNAI